MSKRGGVGNIMLQARKMQGQIKQLQDKLEEQTFDGAAGGGLVSVVVNGRQEVKQLNITSDAINPDDLAELSDLLIAALNMALTESRDTSQNEMKKITGGVNLPGLF